MPPLPFSASRGARTGLLALAVGVLLTSGCSDESNPTTRELEEMLAPSATAASDDSADPAGDLRFDGETRACSPLPNSGAEGAWETSAPRVEVSGGSAEIGLRDADGSGDLPVSVSVTAPDAGVYLATATLTGSEWSTLVFPDDFESGPDGVAQGAHTVVWSVRDGESFISCDGFTGA